MACVDLVSFEKLDLQSSSVVFGAYDPFVFSPNPLFI